MKKTESRHSNSVSVNQTEVYPKAITVTGHLHRIGLYVLKAKAK